MQLLRYCTTRSVTPAHSPTLRIHSGPLLVLCHRKIARLVKIGPIRADARWAPHVVQRDDFANSPVAPRAVLRWEKLVIGDTETCVGEGLRAAEVLHRLWDTTTPSATTSDVLAWSQTVQEGDSKGGTERHACIHEIR